jgi:hypothetical protein
MKCPPPFAMLKRPVLFIVRVRDCRCWRRSLMPPEESRCGMCSTGSPRAGSGAPWQVYTYSLCSATNSHTMRIHRPDTGRAVVLGVKWTLGTAVHLIDLHRIAQWQELDHSLRTCLARLVRPARRCVRDGRVMTRSWTSCLDSLHHRKYKTDRRDRASFIRRLAVTFGAST